MKTFIISIAVLALITVFVIISSVCLVSASGDMLMSAKALPESIYDESFNDVYRRINEKWQSTRAPMRYIAGNCESDMIEDALGDVISYYRAGDLGGYLAARNKLISNLERIKSAETFSCDSLF